MAKTPEVVLFDVGNTLLFPDWQHILAPLRGRGIMVEPEQLRALERQTKREFDASLTAGRVDAGFWEIFFLHLLDSLKRSDAGLQDELTSAIRSSANWNQIRPGTREALERIGERHRIGVISNADGKIANVLAACGIADCFLNITDSGLVGHEKPHPAIFAAALKAMKAQPRDSLYVGDVYSVDYAGATAAGMQAVMFDVSGAYRDQDLPRVESLEELKTHLGC
jgi:putative hydrolase of the HAD superfamily